MLKKRILSIIEIIKKQKLDGVLVSSISNITYLTSFSGFSTVEREAFLLITKNKQYIITDGRYSEAVHAQIKNFELIERAASFSFEKILKKLSQKHKIKRLGIEEDNLTVSEHKLLSTCLNDLNHFNIADLRIIKDSNEIKLIEKACELGDKAFKYILGKVKLEVSEKELAFEIEMFVKEHGADISFPPIVAFGKNSSIPHHQVSSQKLEVSSKQGQFVLFDFGVKLNNYCSDMTRTVFLGKATNEQKKIYRTVLETQKKAIEFLTSHFSLPTSDRKELQASDVDGVARKHIASHGYPSIPHSLGHGVGLEVHEAPRLSPKSKDLLKPGMVFSLEPGIYLPGFGRIRIEDLVVLERSGPRLLTHSPRELLEL